MAGRMAEDLPGSDFERGVLPTIVVAGETNPGYIPGLIVSNQPDWQGRVAADRLTGDGMGGDGGDIDDFNAVQVTAAAIIPVIVPRQEDLNLLTTAEFFLGPAFGAVMAQTLISQARIGRKGFIRFLGRLAVAGAGYSIFRRTGELITGRKDTLAAYSSIGSQISSLRQVLIAADLAGLYPGLVANSKPVLLRSFSTSDGLEAISGWPVGRIKQCLLRDPWLVIGLKSIVARIIPEGGVDEFFRYAALARAEDGREMAVIRSLQDRQLISELSLLVDQVNSGQRQPLSGEGQL